VYFGTAALLGTKWEAMAPADLPPAQRIQIVTPAWGGQLVAVASDGRVFQLDLKAKKWTVLSGKSPLYKMAFPLSAFDAEREVLVLWGSAKSKGRKDDCLAFDGKKWIQPAKGASASAKDLGTEGDGAFCMFFDPNVGLVTRVGISGAAAFDGGRWVAKPLKGAEHLDTWERIIAINPASKKVFSIHRLAWVKSIAEITCTADGVTVKPVATFPSPVTRAANSTGHNVAFDVGVYDAANEQFLAFDVQKNERFSMAL
jgi:hypothetical protein